MELGMILGATVCPLHVPVPSVQPWEVWQERKLEKNPFLCFLGSAQG